MGARDSRHSDDDHRHPLPLSKQVEYLLEECRIVLPGLQVLFGFQLAVVFSDRFPVVLAHRQQVLHLLASMPLLAVAICLEFYLIAQVVLDGAAAWIAGALLTLFALLWLVLPRVARWRKRRGSAG